ncbi:MAG: hypothetical protein PHG48_06950 [Eubacteriales bacterium]|nr:hypothetical protein [Eubacteriales bacterium]
MTKQDLRKYAAGIGLDMLGIAPVSRFAQMPPKKHPASILPEVKSVIVVGSMIPRGDYRGIEEGTNWTFAGKRVNPRQLTEVARYIEHNSGYEAVPFIANNAASAPKSRPVAEGRPIHNVSINMEYAAVAAGFGEIGLCGLLLTPLYGPRNALGIVLTELELEPDDIFDRKICDGIECAKCASICPSKAINTEKLITVNICGHDYKLAEVNYNMCRMCPNGAAPDFDAKIGQEELMHDFAGNQPKILETSTALTRSNVPNILTALCVRTCIAHLEDEDKLGLKYANPFRTSPPWMLQAWER